MAAYTILTNQNAEIGHSVRYYNMAAAMAECLCHVIENELGELRSFTDTTWTKVSECASIWKGLDGIEKSVAVKFDITCKNTSSFHMKCYQKFTDKTRIERALKRKEKGCLVKDEKVSTPKRRKLILRSDFESELPNKTDRRSIHVLPKQCLICRRIKYIKDRNHKRKIERLITCETNADKLLQAAREKNDERLLLQIGDSDPVSIEVRYHPSCYKQYTKCLYKVEKTPCDNSSFDVFCRDVVEERIISCGEVMKISTLNQLFIKTVKEIDNNHMESYRNFLLKKRLLKKYSQLKFFQPSSTACELVFHQSDEDCAFLLNTDIDSESETDSVSETEHDHSTCEADMSQDSFAQLYRAALILKSSLIETLGVTVWPPTADNMSISDCVGVVSPMLHNFLAWSCGLSDIFSKERVQVKDNSDFHKVFSIGQDIVSLSSKGRKLMPKHLSLGMTIRHLTGSAKLQNILNSFGHCVSHSVTLEHDTALATQQLQRGTEVPPGFRPDVFTTLVWDNNDFGEETLSGKGTTHNTNGIIIQRFCNVPVVTTEKSVQRDRKRTINTPAEVIGQYFGPKRTGPVQFKGQNQELEGSPEIQDPFLSIDQSLHFAKYIQTDEPLPGWTGCNQLLRQNAKPSSNIGYLPVIDASPTEKSTVNAILERSLAIADELHLPSIAVVMDQAIYAKAQEIRWQGRPEFRNRLVLRLGEFHTAMAFLGAIGKRFENSGLTDIAIESGVIAEGSIKGVMNGHHYNRSLRCHKIISEALHRLRIQEYIEQLEAPFYDEVLKTLQDIRISFPSKFSDTILSDDSNQLLKNFNHHVQMKCNTNAMYAFWSSYLDMVDLLLLFLRGTREGHWQLHLSSVRSMIPWFFAYGRINYSRYLPCYYLEMKALPNTHPYVHDRLADGEFSVQRTNSQTFSMTACDQIIEQTFNRDSKTRGGLTGITLNKAAVKRWILSHPARAGIANACYSMSMTNPDTSSICKDLNSSRIKADEQAVQDVMTTVMCFANPFTFQENKEVMNICSGKVATETITTDLSTAYNRGEECFKDFVSQRLVDGTKDVFDKLSLPSSKTFSELGKKEKSKQRESSLTKEHRQLLTRMVIIAQEKGLDLKNVMKYQLSSVPPSLANPDGSMVKTNKATLMHEVDKLAPSSCLSQENIPQSNTVFIVDGMALIQQQRQIPETFGDFAVTVLRQLVSMGLKHKAKRVDFVADRYYSNSIKQLERSKRASQGETKIRINRQDQKMPKQFRKYLANCENKEDLLSFLVNEWKEVNCDLHGIQVYATQGEFCCKISQTEEGSINVEDIPELRCDHEEADTRMFLHALHASQSIPDSPAIFIRSVDTDVFILATWVSSLISSRLIMLMLSPGNSRYMDMTAMNEVLGGLGEALIGLHAFTGCDSISSFRGKGKSKALKLMIANAHYKSVFSLLGQEWSVSDSLQEQLDKFVCDLYGSKECVCVDDVRYKCLRFGNVTDITMPPNSDSLKLHIRRANYQAKVFRSCVIQNMSAPSTLDNGWKQNDKGLGIIWNTLPIAPDDILNNINCKCHKSSCNSSKCSCKRNGVSCTVLCRCLNCQNQKALKADADDTNTDIDSSDDD